MKVVIAPMPVRGYLSAPAAASGIAKGVLAACPEATVDLCPMGDGCEGSAEAAVSATGGATMTADVFGPLGAPHRVRFGMLGRKLGGHLPGEVGLAGAGAVSDGDEANAELAGGMAVLDAAAAAGMSLVPVDKRDPLRATSYGVGELILAALDAGAAEVIVCIGDLAGVDGGCGCIQALGASFFDADGEALVGGLGGGGLESISRIDVSGLDGRLSDAHVRLACAENFVLTGPNGAAAGLGPRLGATAETIRTLQAGLASLAEVFRRDLGVDVDCPSCGAGGGLAAGLVAVAGASLEDGFELLAETIALRPRLREADLCITAEATLGAGGRNISARVARLAGDLGVPTICIPGRSEVSEAGETFQEFAAVAPLVAGAVSPQQAVREGAELISLRAEQAMEGFLRR